MIQNEGFNVSLYPHCYLFPVSRFFIWFLFIAHKHYANDLVIFKNIWSVLLMTGYALCYQLLVKVITSLITLVTSTISKLERCILKNSELDQYKLVNLSSTVFFDQTWSDKKLSNLSIFS